MRTKCHLKKDDKVKVLAGKDKGKIGKVIEINSKKGRVLVENINIVKKHSRPSAQNKQGGIIETEAVKLQSPTILERYRNRTAMKRLGNPEEVASLVLYLASEKASYITGAAIPVAGGADLLTF